MSYLELALKDKHAIITGESKQQKITYVAINHSERLPPLPFTIQ